MMRLINPEDVHDICTSYLHPEFFSNEENETTKLKLINLLQSYNDGEYGNYIEQISRELIKFGISPKVQLLEVLHLRENGEIGNFDIANALREFRFNPDKIHYLHMATQFYKKALEDFGIENGEIMELSKEDSEKCITALINLASVSESNEAKEYMWLAIDIADMYNLKRLRIFLRHGLSHYLTALYDYKDDEYGQAYLLLQNEKRTLLHEAIDIASKDKNYKRRNFLENKLQELEKEEWSTTTRA